MNYIIKKYRKVTPDAVLITDLRKTAKKLGKGYITYREYDTAGKYASKTMCTRFGSWNSALAKAGLKLNRVLYIPINELMQNLKNVWDSLGRQPSYGEMVKPRSLYTAETYAKRYGSWKKALREFVHYVDKEKFNIRRKPKDKKERAKYKRKHISLGLRYAVMKRDRYTCCYCGRSPNNFPGLWLEIDHKIPVSQGGLTVKENLNTVCNECNSGKGAKQ